MNIFSGARRIAFIIGLLVLVTGTYHLATIKPDVTLYYVIPSYAAPAKATDGCNTFQSASKRAPYKTKSGDLFYIELCFLASESESGQMLIPYVEAGEQVFMADRDSPEVKKYIDAYEEHLFRLSESEVAQAEDAYSAKYWEEKGRVIGGFGFGLFLFWVGVWAIGWIVRGFMGIPRGQDRRTVPAPM